MGANFLLCQLFNGNSSFEIKLRVPEVLGLNQGCLSPSHALTSRSNLDIFNDDKVI